ncbi:MAG: hypothetical protein U0575_03445 [Phycisphaerales bacterium]
MPWRDWQFWIVTAVAAGGAWLVLRPLLPRRGAADRPCGNCASGAAARKSGKTQLTVGGKRLR